MATIRFLSALSSDTGGNCPVWLPSCVRGRLFASIAFILLLLAGCATEPTQLPAWTFPKLPPPRVAPLPVTVGVHYSEAFLRARLEEKDETIWYMHEPGPASAKLLDSVFAATFETVVHVPTWPPVNGSLSKVALVIVPRVSRVSTLGGYITYELDFYNAVGVLQGTWSVRATAEVSLFGTQESFTAPALREAAAKLLVGLRERPELSAYRSGEKPGTLMHVAAVQQSRNAGIVLLPKASDDDEWLSCIEKGIRDGAPAVQFIGFEQFRDAMFPWFEPAVDQPTTPETWAERLAEPRIAEGAAELGARYALLVGGATENGPGNGSLSCSFSPWGGGCFGFTSGTRHTGLQLTLVDFVRKEVVKDIEVSESGTYTWIGVLVPIPIIDPTETEACRKASAEVGRLIGGR